MSKDETWSAYQRDLYVLWWQWVLAYLMVGMPAFFAVFFIAGADRFGHRALFGLALIVFVYLLKLRDEYLISRKHYPPKRDA
jgi:hypothetical protein